MKFLRVAYNIASWYLIEKAVRLAGAFWLGTWVARYLGPEQYGELAFGLALVTTLAFLSSWGVESLVVRDLVLYPENQGRIVATYFWARLLGGATIPFFVSLYLICRNSDDVLRVLVILLGVSATLSAFDVADSWLQASGRARDTSVVRMVAFVFGIAIRIGLIYGAATIVWFAVAALVESIIVGGLYWWVLRQAGLNLCWRLWDGDVFRSIFIKGRWMILSTVTVVVYSKLDQLAVGELISKEMLGIYAIASSMCGAWNVVGVSIAQAYAPLISKNKKNDPDGKYIKTLREFIFLMLAISSGGSFLLSLLAPHVFDLLLGDGYLKGVDVFSVLIWISVPVYLGVATSQIIVNEEIYWASFVRTGLAMIIVLLLIFPVARMFGVIGVACLMLVGSTIAFGSILFSSVARKVLISIFMPIRR